MYTPEPNRVSEPAVARSLLRSAGVGHLVSAGDHGTLDATVLPFLVDDDMTVVRAHIARANPHWRSLDGAASLLVVPVSDAYVSPSWYPSKADEPRVVPTWNYEVVHVHGVVRVRDDSDFVAAVVRELTDAHEDARLADGSSAARWSVDDAPADFFRRQLRAIVGIEIAVERVEAKRKLSQNRSEADRDGVIAGLGDRADTGSSTVASAMRR